MGSRIYLQCNVTLKAALGETASCAAFANGKGIGQDANFGLNQINSAATAKS